MPATKHMVGTHGDEMVGREIWWEGEYEASPSTPPRTFAPWENLNRPHRAARSAGLADVWMDAARVLS